MNASVIIGPKTVTQRTVTLPAAGSAAGVLDAVAIPVAGLQSVFMHVTTRFKYVISSSAANAFLAFVSGNFMTLPAGAGTIDLTGRDGTEKLFFEAYSGAAVVDGVSYSTLAYP